MKSFVFKTIGPFFPLVLAGVLGAIYLVFGRHAMAIVCIVVSWSGAGWLLFSSFRSMLVEMDLTRIRTLFTRREIAIYLALLILAVSISAIDGILSILVLLIYFWYFLRQDRVNFH